MSKKSVQSTKGKNLLKKIKTVGDITEYRLISNDLTVLYCERKGTGIVTSNILYHIGSRDEARGETGIAHMLEHMLFRRTHFDIQRKTKSASILFDAEIGAITNANTWKDRTTYYFSYPSEHLDRALQIEVERMRGVVLDDKELRAEQTNVLSEHDMHAGDEEFSLAVEMMPTAFFSHPYGHETIGFRNDIVSYTVPKVQKYYDTYYRPNNAVLTIIGDVSPKVMEESVIKHFSNLEKGPDLSKRDYPNEHPQEGIRTITIERQTKTNILAIGVKHKGFPSESWHETMITFDLLGGGKDSILYKKLIDSGKASNIETMIEPSENANLGIIFITLAPDSSHLHIEKEVRSIISSITKREIEPYLKKTIAKVLTSEALSRENSLSLTAELVEYVSAHAWEKFFDSEKILRNITSQKIHAHMQTLFENKNMTIGYFKGTK